MNKGELNDLFSGSLSELDKFAKKIEAVKKIIEFFIENYDILKDDISEEQIGEVSSDMKVKMARINAIVEDVLADSKLLESFIHEIKLLKRKRLNKLNKEKNKKVEEELDKLRELLKKSYGKIIPIPTQQPYIQPYEVKKIPPKKGDIYF